MREARLTDGLTTAPGLLAVSIVIVGGGCALVALSTLLRQRRARSAAFAALGVSALVATFKVADASLLQKDALIWHTRGVEVLDTLTGAPGALPPDYGGKDGYPQFIGALYALTGPVPLVPVIVNCLFLAVSVLLVAAITERIAEATPRLDREGVATSVRIATWTMALCPTLVLWVPDFLRESLTWMLILIGIHAAIRWIQTQRLRHAVVAAVSVLLLYSVRDTIGAGVGVALLLSCVASLPRTPTTLRLWRLLLLGPALLVLPVAWNVARSRFGLSAEEVAAHGESLSTGASSGFASSEAASGYAEILLVRAPRVLAGPFPYELRPNGAMLLAGAEGLVWLTALVLTVYFLRSHTRGTADRPAPGELAELQRIQLVLITVAVVVLAMITLSTGNYGILSRMRCMAFVAVLPMASVGLSLLRRRGAISSNPAPGLRAPEPEPEPADARGR